MKISNDDYEEFIHWRENNDEIYNHHRRNRVPVNHLNSGKFGLWFKFQKEIFKLYRQTKIDSPAANRLFLYLMESCLGYNNDPKSEIFFNAKRISRACNIKNSKTLYDAIIYLQDKNMIFIIEKDDGSKFIRINSSILSWNVDEDRKMCIYQKEIDRLNVEVSE